MNPAETLAAARLSSVGPFVQARPEWLEGWCGPLVASVDLYGDIIHAVQLRTGEMLGLHEIHFRYGGIVMDADVPLSAIRLDLRRPEVRDRLIRCGCPSWARDCAPAVWAWANGVAVVKAFPPWAQRDPRRQDYGRIGANDGRYLTVAAGGQMSGTMYDEHREWVPWWRWHLSRFDAHFVTAAEGRESTPDEAKNCADLAALRAGCVLEEADGWYVPGDTIGWWPKNQETP